MIATTMSPSRVKSFGRRLGWLSLALGLAAVPKCFLCLAAYAGLGTLLGLKLAGPELCGVGSSGPNALVLWSTLTVVVIGALALRPMLLRSNASISKPFYRRPRRKQRP